MRSLARLTLTAGAVLALSVWFGPVVLSHLRSLAPHPLYDLVCTGSHSTSVDPAG